MAAPKVLILRAPGTNCNNETAYAFELAGAECEQIHVNQLSEQANRLAEFQILCIPGGFSFGDDIGAGRILAELVRNKINDEILKFRDDGKLILGICNGFQVLLKTGLLLEVEPEQVPQATLTWNDSGKFEDRWVGLQVTENESPFLSDIDYMYLPVAHAEGKFVTRDEKIFSELDKKQQLVLRYTAKGETISNGQVSFPDNPNGSPGNIAGIIDSTGRVFGLMPHPERFIDPTQHPRWTREPKREIGDGAAIFKNAVDYFNI